ncbi:serendipity locus protein alpha [Drosophila nasuta]|uniref:serendipity locus protein alpha n=1 Tax=Drosophila nasuta TaxID=42062 RepID=UPI00295EA1E9|nr:serendipity locus protein alpha [Drosophila nasuta]
MQLLSEKLNACLCTLNRNDSTYVGDITWLNDFCAEFLAFSNTMQKLIGQEMENVLDVVCLCLMQIVICIRHLESTIQTESTSKTRIQASHQHFIDRIMVCLRRMSDALDQSKNQEAAQQNSLEAVSFQSVLDSLLDALTDFVEPQQDKCRIGEQNMHTRAKHIKSDIDLLLGQALSFANVALQQDKKALSALCQKVMRDCSAFQNECQSKTNYSHQKLRAMTLQHALHQLDDHINDALLRLVFTCFMDFQKISVDKIRNIMRTESDATIDEYIADFDVNLDRATQIGIFAIVYAPGLKIKTMVRSCLASFEYLDTSLIPSLQTNASDLHSELLEQHFKEEISKYKTALHEIIESRAFVACYLQILTTGIIASEKQFDKLHLDDLVHMGFIVLEHFQLEINQKDWLPHGRECFENFIRILRECKAILSCAAQVQTERILKRFKILRTILRKFYSTISADENEPERNEKTVIEEATDENTIEGISTDLICTQPSIILYETRKDRCNNIGNRPALKANPATLKSKPAGGVRRKQSLRTTMFKRHNCAQSNHLQNTISNQSASLEITGILDQLTCLSSTLTHNLTRK